jgi:RNA polymerase sigma-70 factor (ECF subfamily)
MKPKQTLVQELKNKDAHAAGLLVERYGPRLRVAARLLCETEADAQDLLCETIQRAFHSIGSFRGESSLFSWLYGILLNVRRMADRKTRGSRLVYVERLPEVPEEAPPVGLAAERASLAACLAKALERLPQEQQDVVMLRFYGELTVEEVAEALRVSKGTVKSRLFYAMRRMRAYLPQEVKP